MNDCSTSPGLSADTRALAEAIRTAIDLPYAADPKDDDQRTMLLRNRTISVLATLDYLLTASDHQDLLVVVLEGLDAAMARNPVTYTTQALDKEEGR